MVDVDNVILSTRCNVLFSISTIERKEGKGLPNLDTKKYEWMLMPNTLRSAATSQQTVVEYEAYSPFSIKSTASTLRDIQLDYTIHTSLDPKLDIWSNPSFFFQVTIRDDLVIPVGTVGTVRIALAMDSRYSNYWPFAMEKPWGFAMTETPAMRVQDLFHDLVKNRGFSTTPNAIFEVKFNFTALQDVSEMTFELNPQFVLDKVAPVNGRPLVDYSVILVIDKYTLRPKPGTFSRLSSTSSYVYLLDE